MLSSISALEHEKVTIEARLEDLRKGSANKVTVEEKAGVKSDWKRFIGIEKRREKIASAMWSLVEDGTETREVLEELREGWGLDE